MDVAHRRGMRVVKGPDGAAISVADLPSQAGRWVIRRKAIVVAAVKGGLLSMEEACGRYSLTIEEYLSWQAAVDRHGLAGLRTTKIQKYRGSHPQ
jgi:hypothetical protein